VFARPGACGGWSSCGRARPYLRGGRARSSDRTVARCVGRTSALLVSRRRAQLPVSAVIVGGQTMLMPPPTKKARQPLKRECCLLVLNLVSSTLPCIRQPRPRRRVVSATLVPAPERLRGARRPLAALPLHCVRNRVQPVRKFQSIAIPPAQCQAMADTDSQRWLVRPRPDSGLG
jgi:hypothetical protein